MQIDIEPLEALRLYYQGETLGYWRGDIRKNEKQRKLLLPPLLRDFLLGYGRLRVNTAGESWCWHPDEMRIIDDMVVFGKLNQDVALAFRRADFAEPNPQLYYMEYAYNDEAEVEDDEDWEDERYCDWSNWSFALAPLRLRDFLVLLFINHLSMQTFGVADLAQPPELCPAPPAVMELVRRENLDADLPRQFICWDEESGDFWSIICLSDRPRRLFRTYPGLSPGELEGGFNQAFYQKQDFGHALRLLRPLLDYLEREAKRSNSNADWLRLAGMYKLAGRCCWAEQLWEEAEGFYQKAELLFRERLEELLDTVKNFYQAMGNFYAAWPEEAKSRRAYAQVDKICDFVGQGGLRARGLRLQQQGIQLEKQSDDAVDLADLQKALNLYEEALAVFRQDPKDCKYDIARCQQLWGDLRKRIRELAKKPD